MLMVLLVDISLKQSQNIVKSVVNYKVDKKDKIKCGICGCCGASAIVWNIKLIGFYYSKCETVVWNAD